MPIVLKLVKEQVLGNSLVVRWVRLPDFTAEGFGSIPVWEPKILQAAGCGQKNNQKTTMSYIMAAFHVNKYKLTS